MQHYYLAVDLGYAIVKFEADFYSEESANLFADVMADYLVEFSYVQMIDYIPEIS